jgi:hypothetical protein
VGTLLSADLLAAYMRTFYGYGAWTAKYWFIGMEEGGGDSLEEIERRITVWHDRGERDLEDLRDYHLAIGVPQYFGARPKLQRTWRALMRVVLTADHARVDPDALRAYQRNLLGRLPASLNAGTALIERLPLPAPGKTAPWLYGQSGIAALRTRAEYEAALGPPRTQAILDAIDHFQPRAVVTYGNANAGWCVQMTVVRPRGRPIQRALGRDRAVHRRRPPSSMNGRSVLAMPSGWMITGSMPSARLYAP